MTQEKKPCPICECDMEIALQGGIQIDICPEHGVWLDTGEFEKLLSRKRIKNERRTSADVRRARDRGYNKGSFISWLLQKPSSVTRRKRKRNLPKRKLEIKENLEVPEGERPCPICKEEMMLEKRGEITLDICSEHGKWFDLGELLTLINKFNTKLFSRRVRASREAYMEGRKNAMARYGYLYLDLFDI